MNNSLSDKCLACGASGLFSPVFSQSGYQFVKCKKCSFLFVSPRPSEEELNQLYSGEFFTGGMEVSGVVTKNYCGAESSFLARSRKSLSRIKKYKKGGRLLDVGCGLGYFMRAALESGWEAVGVDVSDFAVKECVGRGLDVRRGTIGTAGFPDGFFDVVVAQDLLEHLNDPGEFIVDVRKVLRPGGILLMEMPNANSIPARRLGWRWKEFIPPIHLNFFNKKSINIFLGDKGFRIIEIDSELSLSWGLRDFLGKFRGPISRQLISLVTLAKKNFFYPPFNRAARLFNLEGDLLVVLCVKI